MTEFSYPIYLWILPFIGAVITLAIGGVAFAKGIPKAAIPALLVSALLAFLIGPGMMNDTIQIDKGGLSYNTGFIFATTTHTLKFSDFDEIRVESMRGRKGKKKVTWNIYSHGKKINEVKINTLMKLNSDEIYEELKNHNIQVQLP